MKTKDFEVCVKCGATMDRISDKNTSPLIMECKFCGHREWAEIQISPPWPPDEKAAEKVRVVIYKEKGKMRIEHIQSLRKLHNDFGNLSIKEAVEKIEASQYIDLGLYINEDAQELLKKAESYGLKVKLEKPEKALEETGAEIKIFKRFGAPATVGELGEDSIIIPSPLIIIGGVIILALIILVLSLIFRG